MAIDERTSGKATRIRHLQLRSLSCAVVLEVMTRLGIPGREGKSHTNMRMRKSQFGIGTCHIALHIPLHIPEMHAMRTAIHPERTHNCQYHYRDVSLTVMYYVQVFIYTEHRSTQS